MQTYASSVLYHFVGRGHAADDDRNFEVLCQVLLSMEIRPNAVQGQRGIVTRIDPNRPLQNGELIEQSVCCFCDIHLSQLQAVHLAKYGRFGIGVDRRLLAEWGARPIGYLPLLKTVPFTWTNRLGHELMACWRWLNHFFEDDGPVDETTAKIWGASPASGKEAALEAADLLTRDVMAFLKFYDVELPDDHPENYYMEREWRKYGALPLELPLRQIVVPAEYSDRVADRFPHLAAKVVVL